MTNQDVTNKNVHVHAGWPIQLTAQLTPANAKATYTWTIQGAGGNGSAAINGYVVNNTRNAAGTLTASTATVYTLTPGNDTKATFPDPASSPAMLQSYYYTKAGNFTASVQPQGTTGIVAAKTTFIVAAPAPTFEAQYEGNTEFTQARGTVDFHLFNAAANTGVLFDHPPVHGTFAADGTRFEGHSYFVQVYTENDNWPPINPVDKNYFIFDSGVDTSWPYGNAGTLSNGNVYTDDGPQRAADSYWGGLTVDDSPTMWLMYTPSITGSIDVPLDQAPWDFRGAATGNGTTWVLTPDTLFPVYAPLPHSIPQSGATDWYPFWVKLV